MKNYQTYLFDLDGTLIDTTNLIVACFKYTIPKYFKIDPNEKLIRSLIGLPLKTQLQRYLAEKDFVGEYDFDKIETDHMAHQMEIFPQFLNLFDDVLPLLEKLKQLNKPLGIVTSRKTKTTKLFTERLKIAEYFDLMVTPENTVKHKPNKEPIEYALTSMKANPNHTVYVGDAIYDLQSAQAAGVDDIFIKREGLILPGFFKSLNREPIGVIDHLSKII